MPELSDEENLKLKKRLNEAIIMQDSCYKMVYNVTSLKQLIGFSKGYFTLVKTIEQIKLQFNNCYTVEEEPPPEERAVIKIKKIKWPLLWTDDAKKREILGYGFFLLKYNNHYVESDLIEFNQHSYHMFCPNIEIYNATVNMAIEITAYFTLLENYNPKKFTKPKESENDPFFKFTEIGRTTILVQDIVCLKDPILALNFKIEKSCLRSNYTISKGMLSSLEMSVPYYNSNSNNLKGSTFFGPRLYCWNKASAEVYILPEILRSPFSRFTAQVTQSSSTTLMCIVTEGPNLNLYENEEIYMTLPSNTFNLSNVSVSQIDWNILISSDSQQPTTIVFENTADAAKYHHYLESYQSCLEVWGPNIDALMHEKSARQIIYDIACNKEMALPILTKRPLVATVFAPPG